MFKISCSIIEFENSCFVGKKLFEAGSYSWKIKHRVKQGFPLRQWKLVLAEMIVRKNSDTRATCYFLDIIIYFEKRIQGSQAKSKNVNDID